jgi:glycine/D-amino acid oxidase-like deaminating enzyme
MPAKHTTTTPYWATSATFPQSAKLTEDLATDVVVVGAGMTGLSAAYLLAKAGKRVVVVERDRCAMTDTGHTSAHLTMVTDARLTELVKRFGRNHAQAIWDAGLAAIATIDEVVREHAIDAGFEWVDGFLHAPLKDGTSQEAERLQEDATAARDLGFDAEYVETVPLINRPGIRFANQARIQPRSYLAGVAKAFVALGGRIYEHSAADEFCDDPRAVKVAGHTVHCEDIVIATHNPLVGLAGLAGATLFQNEARAVHQLRDRRTCAARHGVRRAVVGHQRPVLLPPRRAASGL